jgi:pyrroloquinoline quinone (PQQ) biosynthesis protein C
MQSARDVLAKENLVMRHGASPLHLAGQAVPAAVLPPPITPAPLLERIARYPQWARDLLLESQRSRDAVVAHDTWRLMREGEAGRRLHQIMLIGFWPLIERFPSFLALNLLKTSHGRDVGINAARSWLARNLRTEAHHAAWYLDWAEAVGVSRDEMLDGARPSEMTAIVDWCWRISHEGDLAEGMAATNYAIEGVTGDWVRGVVQSERYTQLFAGRDVEKAMRWLVAHAEYDASHPFEALDIIVQILGAHPPGDRTRRIGWAVGKSYELHRLALDAALERAGTTTS